MTQFKSILDSLHESRFVFGPPPKDKNSYLCFAAVSSEGCNGWGRPIYQSGVARGFWRDGGFMDDLGWIGWKAYPIISCPIPVERTRDAELQCTPTVWDTEYCKIKEKYTPAPIIQ